MLAVGGRVSIQAYSLPRGLWHGSRDHGLLLISIQKDGMPPFNINVGIAATMGFFQLLDHCCLLVWCSTLTVYDYLQDG